MRRFGFMLALLSVLLVVIVGDVHCKDASVRVKKQSENPPVFAGHLPSFMERNFNYPLGAWARQKTKEVAVDLIIDKSGRAVDMKCSAQVDPELQDEIFRVIKKMQWYPATTHGVPENSSYVLHLSLMKSLGISDTPFPYGVEKTVTKAEKISSSWNDFEKVDDEDLEIVEKVVMLFPANATTAFNYARALASLGKKDSAIKVLNNCFREYHSNYWSIDSMRKQHVSNLRGARPGYNGRTEIGIALLRSILIGRDSLFCITADLIDKRIIDGDILGLPSEKEFELSLRKQDRMKRDMISEFTKGKIVLDNSTAGWEKITREYSVNEISNSLDYWVSQGRVDNAQVIQLTNLIRQEQEEMLKGKNGNKEIKKLFGVKAFNIWLKDGDLALSQYITEIKNGPASSEIRNYFINLEKNLRANPNLLSNREFVLQSLSLAFPPSDWSLSDKKMFYDHKKKLEDLFHLDWVLRS